MRPDRDRRMTGFSAVLVLIMLMSGCGPTLVPKPDQTGLVDLPSGIITKKVGGVSVSVQTRQWEYNPSELEQFFLPFLLLVRNETDQKVLLNLKMIYLVDGGGNQTQPLPPPEVERTMMDRGYVMTPSAHLGVGMGGHHSFFGMGFEFPINSPRPLGSDIVSLSLPEGEILPGSAVRGFVYFNRIPPAGGTLKLHLEINRSSEDYYFLLRR